MCEYYLLTHLWLPTLVWAILYTSDYYLTIWGAKLYKLQDYYVSEGSYEMTPGAQDDIDNLRPFSYKHILWLIAGIAILLIAGYCVDSTPYLYGILVGFFVFVEVPVHIRHLGNIFLYRKLSHSNPGISGQIKFSKEFKYQQSGMNMSLMTLFLLIIFVLTNSPIILGGLCHTAIISFQHFSYAINFKKTDESNSK